MTRAYLAFTDTGPVSYTHLDHVSGVLTPDAAFAPDNIRALYALSENKTMRDAIRDAVNGGLPTVAAVSYTHLYGAIREQMDALDADDIAYDDTPGVSSFCGAAAALNAEYTLPTVSPVSYTHLIRRPFLPTPSPGLLSWAFPAEPS